MNMMGNFAGFVAPVLGGLILLRTGGDWKSADLLNDRRGYGFSSILDLSRSPESPPQARHKC
jgi:hypothetical protein